MNAAIYTRVSTANGGQDPAMQQAELRDFCQRRGWHVTGEYVDRASGAKEARPGLQALMSDARRRKFDVVLVWKFDRFARSVSHLLRALEEFRASGVEFVSLTEAIDTSTPAGKMVFTVLGAVAELERSLICERVRAGIRHARAKGRKIGRPTVDVDGRRIATLRAQGLSWREIKRATGYSVGSARRAYARPRNVPSWPLATD